MVHGAALLEGVSTEDAPVAGWFVVRAVRLGHAVAVERAAEDVVSGLEFVVTGVVGGALPFVGGGAAAAGCGSSGGGGLALLVIALVVVGIEGQLVIRDICRGGSGSASGLAAAFAAIIVVVAVFIVIVIVIDIDSRRRLRRCLSFLAFAGQELLLEGAPLGEHGRVELEDPVVALEDLGALDGFALSDSGRMVTVAWFGDFVVLVVLWAGGIIDRLALFREVSLAARMDELDFDGSCFHVDGAFIGVVCCIILVGLLVGDRGGDGAGGGAGWRGGVSGYGRRGTG